ncbi:nucleoside/nucleotide kinase family protein [Cellulomonas bogoriensis]|uniref:Uridine kinase n=1 Tax=Cellulomonas bogoriensis 69B4 = DSM 16987 TaxID=1386082 RepID=A0A0A0BX51_9CELL|nr:uridine kinase [Cellulomonas bogoriensis]KGM12993.1 uridine kinase [Cellulomonas bogoriensis 69B4 = DSM 16987]
MTTRTAVLSLITTHLHALDGPTPLVGIDGVDGAGKTMFADALASELQAEGRDVVQVSVDGFHRPRDQRYRQGRTSPRGFYEDSYDLEAFRRLVVDPLRPDGSRTIRTAAFDHRADVAVDGPGVEVPDGTIVLVDGIFLHRPELVGTWDASVFLRVPFETTFARMAARDGFPADPDDPANRRYVEGQRLYLADADPETRATFVVDNTDVIRPRMVDRAG